jgi:AcrR family transcriptional regulator
VSNPSGQLLDTVAALLVESGYEGVSVRKVATRAGVSIGAVQHHFPTKDAMLLAAMALVSRQFRERLSRRVPEDAAPVDALEAVVDELLGAEPEHRPASVLWLMQVARAAVDPVLAEAHAREWRDVEQMLAYLIAGSRPEQAESWSRDQAAALLAMLDGLATAVLLEPDRMPPSRARALVGTHLAELLRAS